MSMIVPAELHTPRLRAGVRFNVNVWKSGDGPSFGIFSKMPPGSRFLGSRNLSTSQGVLRAMDIGLGVDVLDGFQLAAYLEDIIAQGRCWNRANEFYAALDRQKQIGAAVDQGARSLVGGMMEGNLEVVWPLDPPVRLMADIRAAGWNTLVAVA